MPFVTLGPSSHDVLSDVSGNDHHVDTRDLITSANQFLRGNGLNSLTSIGQITQVIAEAGTDTISRPYSAQRATQAIKARAFENSALFSS